MSQGFGTPPQTAQSGSTQVYVQESSPAEGDFAWVWYKPSTEATTYYAPGAPTAPDFTVDPVISGTALVGSTLTCNGGTVSGSPTPSKTYQWKRDGTNLSGETASTYVLASGDVAHAITCTVTATNTGGTDSAGSNTITPAIPANSVAPAVTGSAVTGQTLTCSTGTWSGSPTYSYQWKRASSAISGATASTYVLQVADEGLAVKCTVTATNANGSGTPADSNSVTPSASPTAPGQVTGLGATAGDAQVALTWTAPASNGGSAITTYLVEYRTPAGSGSYTTFTHGASTTPSIAVTGLTNASQYEFRVSAVNAIGTGTPSATTTATPVAASVQTPADIFGADLVWWGRASDTPGVDGDSLASIAPTAGSDVNNMVQATSGKRPILKTGILNGKSVWRLDGIDDSAKVTFSAAVSVPYTLGIVYKTRALGSTSKTVVAFNNNDAFFLLSQEGDGTYGVDWVNSDHVIYGHSPEPLNFHAWTGSDNGTTGEIRLDGATVTAGTGPHTAPQTAIYLLLGTRNDGSQPSDIDVAEVFLAKRVATSGDRAALATYNTSEYGL